MNNHLEIVQAIYQAFGSMDIPTILSHLDENVLWEEWADNSGQKAGVPWLQPKKGKEATLDFFKLLGQLNLRDFRVLSLMQGAGQVAAEVVIDLEIPSTGKHFRDEEIHLWTFNEGGKVSRFRHYTDTKKHIDAAANMTEA